MTAPDTFPVQKMLSVSELNHLARDVLETSFPLFWISGEISNFTRAASGHWYFSLKDQTAQVRCVMFKGRNHTIDFVPREGDKIEARCTATLYAARGDFQLTIEFLQKAGLGDLFEAFERLKLKLKNEGLFDPAYKKILPQHPNTIGIVTSKDAAALRDVLATLSRRNPNINVIIYPTVVQGKGAEKTIANAINSANERHEVDTLIICRGGGSIEDLWPFNEEVVARAVTHCSIPTISGIGHETDFTICDFVADIRATTPTAAAELACENTMNLKQELTNLADQLHRQINLNIRQREQALDFLAKRLISPAQKLIDQQTQLTQLHHRLTYTMQQQLQTYKQQCTQLMSSLAQLNPRAVLGRGYAIVSSDHKAISDSSQLQIAQAIHIELLKGSVEAKVLKKD